MSKPHGTTEGERVKPHLGAQSQDEVDAVNVALP